MISESYISATSSNGTAYGAVTPDNYLVSPQVRLGGSISFYAGARNTSYCAEKFSVMVSTTDNTNTASFTTVATWTLSLSSAGYTSSPYTVDLSAYSGMGYIAIRHFDCNDQWVLCIDDITIVEGENQSSDNGTFNYGETCRVTATPNTGYYFINWTENGSTVSTEAAYSFTVTGNRDLVAVFSNQSNQTVEQEVALITGWNWFVPTENITLAQLEEALGTYGLIIKTQTETVFYEDGIWEGDDIVLVPGHMYKIKVSSGCSFTLSGIAPTSVTIEINYGSNWFGYTGPEKSIVEILSASDFTPAEGDIIKTNSETTFFEDGVWEGDFTSLQPGQGYIYISKDHATKQLTFQGSK